eukprot:1146482-Rhodomonas_salina.4
MAAWRYSLSWNQDTRGWSRDAHTRSHGSTRVVILQHTRGHDTAHARSQRHTGLPATLGVGVSGGPRVLQASSPRARHALAASDKNEVPCSRHGPNPETLKPETETPNIETPNPKSPQEAGDLCQE